MECVRRPNRSDVHLTEEEEAKMEVETREYFGKLAPKRHSKPQRSEYSSQYVDAIDSGSDAISEFAEFQRLQNNTEKLSYGGSKATEEFVETEYYKDLNCIEKQHHTTGTGFIKVEDANGKSFSLALDGTHEDDHHASCKGNPATNDWIPSGENTVADSSNKPNRSDN